MSEFKLITYFFASVERFVLNTSCTISVYGTDDQKLADKGIEVCKKYEKVLSKTIKNSDVWKNLYKSISKNKSFFLAKNKQVGG